MGLSIYEGVGLETFGWFSTRGCCLEPTTNVVGLLWFTARNGRTKVEELAMGCWVVFKERRGPSLAPMVTCVVEEE